DDPSRASVSSPKAKPVQLKRRLLVVDDDDTIRRGAERMLGRRFDVLAVEDGDKALTLLRAGEMFDAVMSDVTMPNLTGPDLYRAIRAHWPALAARFVLLTGAGLDPED